MSLTSLIFGEKPKKAGPLKQSVEEKALMESLMNLYYKKDSTGKITGPATSGPMSDYKAAMQKIIGTQGMPINWNGKSYGTYKPLKAMTTQALLEQALLKDQTDPLKELWQTMYNSRFSGANQQIPGTPGLIGNLGGAAIQAGAGTALKEGAAAAGSYLMDLLPTALLA